MFGVNDPHALKDARQEQACVYRADGLSQVDAYQSAGYSDSNNASRFFRQPHIRARVKQRRDYRTVMADLDHVWVLKQFKAIARNGELLGKANLDDYFSHNAEGERIGIDLSDVPRSKMAALCEVTVEQYTEGPRDDPQTIKRTKIRLKPAAEVIQAAELIGKHLGMFVNKHELTGKDGGPIETTAVSDKDRARALAAFVARTRVEKP